MSDIQSFDRGRSPDASIPQPAFGPGGCVAHLVMELWARLHVCVAQALLRSVITPMLDNGRLLLEIHANDAWSYARVLANRATVELLMEAIADVPTEVLLSAADQQGAAGAPGLPSDLAEVVEFAGPLCAVSSSPSLSGAVVASGAPGVVEFDDELGPFRVAESVALARLDRERRQAECICKFCQDNKRLIVITGHRWFEGKETCMGADLRPVLERRKTAAYNPQKSDLVSLGTWISQHLVNHLYRKNPATLLIARGGSFRDADVEEFRRLVAGPIRTLQALGWEVHLAIGHANLVLSLPGTYEYDVPKDGALALKAQLDGPAS